jgi:hypothetical protein
MMVWVADFDGGVCELMRGGRTRIPVSIALTFGDMIDGRSDDIPGDWCFGGKLTSVILLTSIFGDHIGLIFGACIAVLKAFIYSGGKLGELIVGLCGCVLGGKDAIGEVDGVKLDRFEHQLLKLKINMLQTIKGNQY